MNIKQLHEIGRDKVYQMTTSERITNNTPVEQSSRHFPIGSRAYIWTNESLSNLKKDLGIDLSGRNMLIISASGDPFATFAYLGASGQVGFDTSHRAVLWTELKLAAIQGLDYEEFKTFLGLNPEDKKAEKKAWQKVEPTLSKYAKSIWQGLLKKHGTLREVIQSGNYFRQYCSGAFPQENIYCSGVEAYNRTRQALSSSPTILVPGGLDEVLGLTESKFDGFYASNILDHFQDENGAYSGSEISLAPFLGKVDSVMRRDSVMIFNFEHNANVRNSTQNILSRLGYKMQFASKPGSGYGTMAVASRRGRKKK